MGCSEVSEMRGRRNGCKLSLIRNLRLVVAQTTHSPESRLCELLLVYSSRVYSIGGRENGSLEWKSRPQSWGPSNTWNRIWIIDSMPARVSATAIFCMSSTLGVRTPEQQSRGSSRRKVSGCESSTLKEYIVRDCIAFFFRTQRDRDLPCAAKTVSLILWYERQDKLVVVIWKTVPFLNIVDR